MSDIKMPRLTIKIGQKEIELSFEQVQELRQVLNDMFGKSAAYHKAYPAQAVWYCKNPDSTGSVTVTSAGGELYTTVARTTKWDTS